MNYKNMEIPTRSTSGLYATAAFFQDSNEIDIYIEDTANGYRKIFSHIISRVLKVNNIGIDRIFPLGDRNRVISTAREAELQDVGQSNISLFLVDGDLFLLTGEKECLPSNLIALDRYCIENYLVDFKAWLEVMDEEAPELTTKQIISSSDFSGWVQRSRPLLRKLFEEFAVSHYLQSGLKTTSRGYRTICKDEMGEVSSDKIETEIAMISKSLDEQFGNEAVCVARDWVAKKIKEDTCFLHTYVSAKDYILPLLIIRLRKITNSKNSNINLKIRLSKKCDVGPLENLFQNVFAKTSGQ